MSKDDAPAPPDYSPLIAAQTAAAEHASQVSADNLAWAKEQYQNTKALTDRVNAGLLDTQDRNAQIAKDANQRYLDVFQPQEDALVRDADTYASQEKKDQMVGMAQAGVGQAFDAARDSSTRELESFGINPADTRYKALDIGTRAQEAAAKAGAGNIASQQVDATARDLRNQAIALGQTTAGRGVQADQVAGNAGLGAVGATNSTTTTGASTMGTGLQWDAATQTWRQGAVNTMNTQYSNQMDNFKANQTSSSGIGSLLGTVAGLAIPGGGTIGGAIGSKIGGMLFSAEGGPVPDPSQVATTGGAVPTSASPSQGQVTDDVPAQLNAGEFVIPKDVTSWYGQKFMQDLIKKARAGMNSDSEAPAQPSVGVGAIPRQPAFQSAQAQA